MPQPDPPEASGDRFGLAGATLQDPE